MKENGKKTLSFSYLDVFLLLVAGLIISMGIYFALEQAKQDQALVRYQVELEGEIDSYLQAVIPQEGENIFNEKGEMIGFVQTVVREESSSFLKMRCELIEICPNVGESFRLETKNGIFHLSVRETVNMTENKGGEIK